MKFGFTIIIIGWEECSTKQSITLYYSVKIKKIEFVFHERFYQMQISRTAKEDSLKYLFVQRRSFL